MAKTNKTATKATPSKIKRSPANEKIQGPKKILTAKNFIEQLKAHQSDEELKKIQRYFKSGEGEYGEGDTFIGVRMGQVFTLAKEFVEMSPGEIEKLLESSIHEVRAGALSIMDKQARNKKTPETRRKELFELYLKRMDRINNWDLVDVSAPFVVGGYLFDKPRDILYKLAKSKNIWERRTAIVSTAYFLRETRQIPLRSRKCLLTISTTSYTRPLADGCGRQVRATVRSC